MNQNLVRRLARYGAISAVTVTILTSCGGGSSSTATTVKRIKNSALPTTTIEGATDTTIAGEPTDTTTAPTDTAAPSDSSVPATTPSASQVALTQSNGEGGDQFGGAVVLSEDGSTLAVGALRSKSDQGSVTVFGRSGGKWVEQDVLSDADGAAKDWFGYSMAISKDGSTLAIGAVYADVNGKADQGNVLVYARSADGWNLQQKLTEAVGKAGDVFGLAVSISADGNTLAVGAPGADANGVADQGAVSVFTRSGGAWKQQQTLSAVDGAAKSNFGSSVSLSSDGNTLAVGGPNAGKGSVLVFTRANGTWS